MTTTASDSEECSLLLQREARQADEQLFHPTYQTTTTTAALEHKDAIETTDKASTATRNLSIAGVVLLGLVMAMMGVMARGGGGQVESSVPMLGQSIEASVTGDATGTHVDAEYTSDNIYVLESADAYPGPNAELVIADELVACLEPGEPQELPVSKAWLKWDLSPLFLAPGRYRVSIDYLVNGNYVEEESVFYAGVTSVSEDETNSGDENDVDMVLNDMTEVEFQASGVLYHGNDDDTATTDRLVVGEFDIFGTAGEHLFLIKEQFALPVDYNTAPDKGTCFLHATLEYVGPIIHPEEQCCEQVSDESYAH